MFSDKIVHKKLPIMLALSSMFCLPIGAQNMIIWIGIVAGIILGYLYYSLHCQCKNRRKD